MEKITGLLLPLNRGRSRARGGGWRCCAGCYGVGLGADLVLEGVPGDGEPFPQALDARGDEDEGRGADELGGGGSRRAWR